MAKIKVGQQGFGIEEEGHCEKCGASLFVGDGAWWDVKNERLFCSKSCAGVPSLKKTGVVKKNPRFGELGRLFSKVQAQISLRREDGRIDISDDDFSGAMLTRLYQCPQADREHRESDRQYMHVGHLSNAVCFAKATHALEPEYKLGLLVHEMGHLGMCGWQHEGCAKKHTENQANQEGERLTGIRVVFHGPKALERSEVPSDWL